MDPNDIVFFDRKGNELYRVKSNTEFKTYIVRNNGSLTEAPMPNIIQKRGKLVTTGFIYQKYDYQIAASTENFNLDKSEGKLELWTDGNNQIPSSAISKIPSLNPTMVKAVAMQESKEGTDPGHNGRSDIMQVNNGASNFEDFAPYKEHYGLSKGTIPDPRISINAGIKNLATKGFRGGIIYNQETGESTFKFQGWDNAIINYNGGGAAKHGQNYFQSVENMIDNAIKPQPNNY
ncbi:MAG: hypothetical protein ACRDE2_12885 [Chitinophagaceae bacterium]